MNSYFFKNVLFAKKNDMLQFETFYNGEIKNAKTINIESGFNKNIIKYSEKNNIYNYKMANQLLKLKDNYNIVYKQEFDLMNYYTNIKIYREKDLLHEFNSFEVQFYDNEDFEFLSNIINGSIIMSRKKEIKIIDKVSEVLHTFGLDVDKYVYKVIEVKYNVYELDLTHEDTEAKILVKNIVLNENNNVISVGSNVGLVF